MMDEPAGCLQTSLQVETSLTNLGDPTTRCLVPEPSNGCPMDYPTLLRILEPSIGHPLDDPGRLRLINASHHTLAIQLVFLFFEVQFPCTIGREMELELHAVQVSKVGTSQTLSRVDIILMHLMSAHQITYLIWVLLKAFWCFSSCVGCLEAW